MRDIKFRAFLGGVMHPKWTRIDEDVYKTHPDIKIMQYTGLHDKNGKEIYESDYLGDWCVFWGSGKYILHNISSGDIIDCNEQNTQNKEITGNRFETPKQHSAMATDF